MILMKPSKSISSSSATQDGHEAKMKAESECGMDCDCVTSKHMQAGLLRHSV